jgi:L-fuculose-phosphate aldolase
MERLSMREGCDPRMQDGSNDLNRDETKLRETIIAKARWMNSVGLNQGTSGNISARYGGRMLITPTAIPYDSMKPAMLASFEIDGEYGAYEGPRLPSTEWRFHLDILKARPEINAIVHTHSTYATVLGIARKPIPACHYMVAAFGGTDVRVAGYATYGTKALAENAVKALEGRTGCLLANHGMIALGRGLDEAMWRAVELETIAKQYYHTLLIPGGPVILPDAAIEETLKAFGSYGIQGAKRIEKALAGRPKSKSAPRSAKRR